MARRAPYPLRVLGTDLVAYAGGITVGATGAVSASRGFGATIARTGVGVYTITFDEKWPYVQCFLASENNDAGAQIIATTSTWSYSSTTGVITVTFRTISDGAAGELNEGADISFFAILQTRNVLGQS